MKTRNAPFDGNSFLPPFLSTLQVASLLGLHPATLRQWRHQRRGPSYTKLGGVVRYARESVLGYVEERTKLGSEGVDVPGDYTDRRR